MLGQDRIRDVRGGESMSSPTKLAAAFAVVAVALLAGLARPAAAATPCWKTLLTDWYDGRIDGTYPIHCYSDALKHLPADVQTYSSAHDDILRALQSAEARLKKNGHKTGPLTPVPPPSNGGATTTTSAPAGGGSSGGGSDGGTDAGGGNGGQATSTVGHKPAKGLAGVADKLNPSSPSSFPVPLLVLGGLAILLVAAGGIGLVAKRLQDRRAQP
jgi:hypothetical protein